MDRNSKFRLLFVVLLVLFASPAFANITVPEQGVLNDIANTYLEASSHWGGVITGYATWLFWVLATISMVWTFGMMALRNADISEFFSEFIRFTVTTGFFWWLLQNGPEMALNLIKSMQQIGAEASTAGGYPTPELQPSTPVTLGLNLMNSAVGVFSLTTPIVDLGMLIILVLILLCLAVVSANILITLITAYVMVYAGVFILGFGGAKWTSEMAIGYFKTMLAIGMELMTMTLVIGVAMSQVTPLIESADAISLYELLVVLCVCVVLAMLIEKIPNRINLLVGAPLGATGGGQRGVGDVVRAAAGVAAGVAGGAAALMAAAAAANKEK